MGVLQKNEQHNEDMTDICSFLNQYIPGAREEDDTRKPDKVLSGGDYLTFERHKQAQSAKRNGRTPMIRMEGLVPKLEEFHNQAEFLKVMWKVLYCTSSSKDTGTLYAARNTINAKNVSKDPSSNYYVSSELVNKFTKAYCVAAALEHFKMETVETAPTHNLYHGAVGDEKEMKDYILSQAEQVITAYTSLDIPNIPETGYQSNNIVWELCRREFQLATTLERHQLNAHNIDPPPRNNEARLTDSPTEQDYILNYSKVSLTLGFLKLYHDNAICMGDGERILRIDKVFYLYYKKIGLHKICIWDS